MLPRRRAVIIMLLLFSARYVTSAATVVNGDIFRHYASSHADDACWREDAFTRSDVIDRFFAVALTVIRR